MDLTELYGRSNNDIIVELGEKGLFERLNFLSLENILTNTERSKLIISTQDKLIADTHNNLLMATCPGCFEVKAMLSGNQDFEIIDIGEHVRNLKEFIRLRDTSPA